MQLYWSYSFDSKIDTGILKIDISDHFPIFFTCHKTRYKPFYTFPTQREITYKTFLNVFSNLYEIAFPKVKIKVNSKTQLNPWIPRGILKSSKCKQNLSEKFLKNRNSVNKEDYKTFTRLFESIKQKSIKNYYHNLLITYGNDMKRTWATIKEIIGSKKNE